MLLALVLSLASQTHLNVGEIIDTWQVPLWGDFTPGDADVVPLHSRIDLWSIACEESDGAYACFPARLRLPDSAPSMSGVFVSGRAELRRLHQCFDVTLRKAPDDVVVAARAQDLEPVRPLLAARAARAQARPTLLLVAWSSMDSYPRTFDYFFHRARDQGWSAIALPPPEPIDEMTIGIVAAPGAHGVVNALRAENYRLALQRAKSALANARKDVDDKTRAALRANLAAAALFAGSKRSVPAVDDFPDAEVDGGLAEMVALARRWAKGEVLLGPDPCVR